MLLLGLDFETTGLLSDPDSRITEIGAVLWDTDFGCEVGYYHTLVHPEDTNYPAEVVEITGLSLEVLTKYGVHTCVALAGLLQIAARAERAVAHNADFEKEMLLRELSRYDIPAPDLKWIDSYTDVPHPSKMPSKKLEFIGPYHRYLPRKSHRAIDDVLLMLDVLSAYPLEENLFRADSPNKALRALVSFDQKELAKKLNYRWIPEEKIWCKKIKEFELEDEQLSASTAGFKTQVLEWEQWSGKMQ